MNNNSIKQTILKIINADDNNYLPSQLFDTTIIVLIIISIISIILSTFQNIPTYITKITTVFEYISIIIFTIEYALRIWTSDLIYDLGPVKSRIKFAFTFMAIIDLLSILPFYISFVHIDLRLLRALRLFRMLRIFKLNRYTTALNSVVLVLNKKKDQLISSMFVVTILMIISSILIYYCEHSVQPDVFDNAFSGLWWAVATLTTVGYGDIYPITVIGKILSAFLAILGIGLVAVPTGIISAGFSEELEDKNDEKMFCPYCGKKLQ